MTPTVASFADLLRSAVTEPGIISGAYRQFHNYSIGNQLLAWAQCIERGIQPGPMATFPKLEGAGPPRPQGREGDHALQPVTVKRTREQETDTEGTDVYTRFVYRPDWFVLAQTDGADLPPVRSAVGRGSRPGGARRRRDPVRRDGRQRPGLRARPVDRDHPGQPDAAQDAVSRAGPCAARPHGRRRAGRRRADARGTCASAKPKRWRCCAVRRWTCRVSSLAAATSRAWWGAGNPIPERSAQRSSRRPIRS